MTESIAESSPLRLLFKFKWLPINFVNNLIRFQRKQNLGITLRESLITNSYKDFCHWPTNIVSKKLGDNKFRLGGKLPNSYPLATPLSPSFPHLTIHTLFTQTLPTLDLVCNKIGDEGEEDLADALPIDKVTSILLLLPLYLTSPLTHFSHRHSQH